MKHTLLHSKAARTAGYIFLICLGNIMVAAGIYFFKAPYGFAFGGVSGISILLAKLFPIVSQATYMTVLNILLLLLGVIFSGGSAAA